MKACPFCGMQNDDDAITCRFCYCKFPSAPRVDLVKKVRVNLDSQQSPPDQEIPKEPPPEIEKAPAEEKKSESQSEQYQLLNLLHSGAFTDVYQAKKLSDQSIIAIKILKKEFADQPEICQKFQEQYQINAQLKHSNILKIYDTIMWNHCPAITMEYIDGITLEEYKDIAKHLEWKELLYFIRQVLYALQYAHEKEILHGNICPQNIMLLNDGTVKMMNFRVSESGKVCLINQYSLNASYVSPEQIQGKKGTEKSDIYAVGVMLYELLTGRKNMTAIPERPRKLNPEIPEGLEEIILHAMEKEPDQRYQTAVGMRKDIKHLLENPEISFEYIKHHPAMHSEKKADPEPEIKPEQKKPEIKPEQKKPEIKPEQKKPKIKPEQKKPEIKPEQKPPEIEPKPKNNKSFFAYMFERLFILFIGFIIFILSDLLTRQEIKISTTLQVEWLLISIFGAIDFIIKINKKSEDRAKQVLKSLRDWSVTLGILSIFIIVINLHRMPYLIGNNYDEIRNSYEYLDIQIKETDFSSYEKDVIYYQDFAYGNTIFGNRTVYVNVSQGKNYQVMDFIGDSLTEAQKICKEAGLSVKLEKFASPKAAGTILTQSIQPGEIVTPGTEIILTYSDGIGIKIPDVSDMDYPTAKSALETEGFKIIEKIEISEKVKTFCATRTEPAADEMAAKGSVVKLYISQGDVKLEEYVEIPDMKDKTLTYAESFCSFFGLELHSHKVRSQKAASLITAQSIPGGHTIEMQSNDRLCICYSDESISESDETYIDFDFFVPLGISGDFYLITGYRDYEVEMTNESGEEATLKEVFIEQNRYDFNSDDYQGIFYHAKKGITEKKFIIGNYENGKEATLGIYKLNFNTGACTIISETIQEAFEAVASN